MNSRQIPPEEDLRRAGDGRMLSAEKTTQVITGLVGTLTVFLGAAIWFMFSTLSDDLKDFRISTEDDIHSLVAEISSVNKALQAHTRVSQLYIEQIEQNKRSIATVRAMVRRVKEDANARKDPFTGRQANAMRKTLEDSIRDSWKRIKVLEDKAGGYNAD